MTYVCIQQTGSTSFVAINSLFSAIIYSYEGVPKGLIQPLDPYKYPHTSEMKKKAFWNIFWQFPLEASLEVVSLEFSA